MVEVSAMEAGAVADSVEAVGESAVVAVVVVEQTAVAVADSVVWEIC